MVSVRISVIWESIVADRGSIFAYRFPRHTFLRRMRRMSLVHVAGGIMAENSAGHSGASSGVYLNQEDAKKLQDGIATIANVFAQSAGDHEVAGLV